MIQWLKNYYARSVMPRIIDGRPYVIAIHRAAPVPDPDPGGLDSGVVKDYYVSGVRF